METPRQRSMYRRAHLHTLNVLFSLYLFRLVCVTHLAYAHCSQVKARYQDQNAGAHTHASGHDNQHASQVRWKETKVKLFGPFESHRFAHMHVGRRYNVAIVRVCPLSTVYCLCDLLALSALVAANNVLVDTLGPRWLYDVFL